MTQQLLLIRSIICPFNLKVIIPWREMQMKEIISWKAMQKLQKRCEVISEETQTSCGKSKRNRKTIRLVPTKNKASCVKTKDRLSRDMLAY